MWDQSQRVDRAPQKSPPPQVLRSPLYQNLPEARQRASAATRSHDSSQPLPIETRLSQLLRRLPKSRPQSAEPISAAQPQGASNVVGAINFDRTPVESALANGTISFQQTLRYYPGDRPNDISSFHPLRNIHAMTTIDASGERSPTRQSSSQHHNSSTGSVSKLQKQQAILDRYQHCGTQFMVDQLTEVRTYEETLEKEQKELAFQSERKWALLRMRQVEKDTRTEREAAQKKRLREARVLARRQEDELFAREKEIANHSERKERTNVEDLERKLRRRLAHAMWSNITLLHFTKLFTTNFREEQEQRCDIVETFIYECESRVRAFLTRITTSERTSVLQLEKSERIVTLRYVTAFSAWRADQEQQVNNLMNTERKQRYRVCDTEDIAFGEIDAIKQGILSDIAREARRKQEARLAAIREMETFHHHQRRAVDDEESTSRNTIRGDDQTIRNQMRMSILDDRKAATEATNQRKQREFERWKQHCWLQQQPYISSEAEGRHNIELDESTAFRLLQLLRQQLWDEILTPMVLLTTDDSLGPANYGKRYLRSLQDALKETANDNSTSDLTSTPLGSAAPVKATDPMQQSSGAGSPRLYKLRSAAATGVTRLTLNLAAPYSSPGVTLCPGIMFRRKMDNRHYTSQALTNVAIVVRLRGGGSPGDEVQLLSSNVHTIRDKSASAMLTLQSGPIPAAGKAGGAKGSSNGALGGLDAPAADSRVLAQQLLYPSLRTVEGTIYDEENVPLGTIESCSGVPSLENCVTYTDWAQTRAAMSEEQHGEDGVVLLSMALPQIERDNAKQLERIIQSLVFVPGAVETVPTTPRRIDIEIHFQAPVKRRQSTAALPTSAKPAISAFASAAALTGNRSVALSVSQTVSGGSPTLGLTSYRLVISVNVAPAAPLLCLASPMSLLFQGATRGVLFHDQRPAGPAPGGKEGKASKEAPKILTQLLPTTRGGLSLCSTWWGSVLSQAGVAKLLPLDADFQGAVVRFRLLDGSASEDTLQFVPNEEFSLKRDEVKYTPPPALASVVDPFVCARLAYGKIIPVYPTSTKDIWFSILEAPSYWQPTAASPQYVSPLLLHNFLSRIYFSTTSASTQRRAIEVTVVLHKKFGGSASTVRMDVVNSGNAATTFGSWSGVDDIRNLQQKFIDSHQPTPEHLRSYLEPDVTFPFRYFKIELGGKIGLSASETTLIGAGALRCSISGDSTYLWDRLELESRSAKNPFGLLVVATASSGAASGTGGGNNRGSGGVARKLMWSMHSTDESALVHVGYVRHISSLEGKLRPSLVVDFNENCRFGTILAVVRSLSYSTTVPPSADGISKIIMLEIALGTGSVPEKGGAAGAASPNGSPLKGKGPRNSEFPGATVSGSTAIAATPPSVAAQLLAPAVGPLRIAVHVVCTQSAMLTCPEALCRNDIATLPRLESTADKIAQLVASGNTQVLHLPGEDGPLGAPVVPMLLASKLLAPALHYLSHGSGRDSSFDGAVVELSCFSHVDAKSAGPNGSAAAGRHQSFNATVSSLNVATDESGSIRWDSGKKPWALGIRAHSTQIVEVILPDEQNPEETTEESDVVDAPSPRAVSEIAANNADELQLKMSTLSWSGSEGSYAIGDNVYQWAPQSADNSSKNPPQLLAPLTRNAPLSTIATILSATGSSLRSVTLEESGSDAEVEGNDNEVDTETNFARVGPTFVSLSTLSILFGTKRRDVVGSTLQVKGKHLAEVLKNLVVNPGFPTSEESSEVAEGTASPTNHSTPTKTQNSSPRSFGSASPPSSPSAAAASTATRGASPTHLQQQQQQSPPLEVDERIILRVAITDMFGHRQQCAVTVEVTPKNLPSTFENIPAGPFVWRAGSEGYVKDSLILLPHGTIEDEDTEATGEAAYLRVESLAGFSQEDKIVFLSDNVPKHLQLLPAPLKIVEFVEPLNREGELRRYHVRYEAPGSSDEMDIGSGTLTCGVPNPVFSFVFAADLPLNICSQVLRQVGFRHDERFPRQLHNRQLLLRFNAMDGDGVVDTRHVLDVQVAPPLMYTLPLYETAKLRHQDSKQVPLFPKVLVGIAPSSELGQTLTITLDTRAFDERLVLDVSEDGSLIFVEQRGGAKYISFHCQYAETIFASVTSQRTTPFAASLGLENLPVTPTPGYEGVVFAKVLKESEKLIELQLADETITRGHDILPAACIPILLSKVLFRTDAFDPILTTRSAIVKWRFSAELAATVAVRILVESGEPIGSLSTNADSMDVFLQHPALVIPDVSIGDLAMDTILGKEAEITAMVVDPTTSDQLCMGIGGVYDLIATGVSAESLGPTTVRYAVESRTIIVDDEEVAWVETGRGLMGGSKLVVKFSQCPASVAQFILRRIAYSSEDPLSVGRARLLEITLRIYASQPAPSMLHVQTTVRPFPFTFPVGYSGRFVDCRVLGQTVPVCRNGVGWSAISAGGSGSSASGSTTRGLVIVAELIHNVPAEGTLFQNLFDTDPVSLPQVLPRPTNSFPWYDRMYVKTLPQHLSFGGAGRTAHSIVWTGKGVEVCRYDVSSDFQRMVLTFSSTRQVPHQLVLDILGALVYEFRDEGGDPNATLDSSLVTGDLGGGKAASSGAKPKKGTTASPAAPAGPVPLPSALAEYVKGSRRCIALRIQTILPSSLQSGSGDGVAIGTDIIPISIVM
ncbi:Hypothetical protein, putative [Bodo saltans]|uniref:Uncharacterized protein n=1 Tax=Bodo saltans TaxID=75058 RepID=A0A0S4ILJ4_BODSA|nr:Hypothetical protein, putative [Bodo saltans]|eukprot:CUE71323.1 Hypothetical protein, putative [Bodo saltans]